MHNLKPINGPYYNLAIATFDICYFKIFFQSLESPLALCEMLMSEAFKKVYSVWI